MSEATEATEPLSNQELLEKRVRSGWLHMVGLGWVLLLFVAVVLGVVQISRILSVNTTLGYETDFQAGSVTPFELNSTFEDPTPLDESAREISPVPIFLVHAAEAGFFAFLQRDPGSGCAVMWVAAEIQFIDPCSGSAYNMSGEHISGPARRGLDRFQVFSAGRDKLKVSVKLFALGPASSVGVDG